MKQFPIHPDGVVKAVQFPHELPWAFVEQYEKNLIDVRGMSFERVADFGGYTWRELWLAIFKHKGYPSPNSESEAARGVMEVFAGWRARN